MTPQSIRTSETHQPKRRRLEPYAWPDLQDLPRREYIIKRLLDRQAMSVIYGPSNSGKTFIALDLALHIALGWEWRGRRVRQGRVVYIAVEGGVGVQERLRAFELHHGIAPTNDFYVLPAPIDLCQADTDADALIAEIQRLSTEDDPVEMVIVDTLSRALSGGDENAPDDMGAFIGKVDRIRQETKAHVAVIHHSGKEAGKGARGHSALRAATDTEIEVSNDEVSKLVTAEVKKQRDYGGGEAFTFNLDPIEINRDEDGDPVTSCALVAADGHVVGGGRPRATGKKKLALDVLNELVNDHGAIGSGTGQMPANVRVVSLSLWREYLKKRDIVNADGNAREQFRRIKDGLREARLIGIWDEQVWVV